MSVFFSKMYKPMIGISSQFFVSTDNLIIFLVLLFLLLTKYIYQTSLLLYYFFINIFRNEAILIIKKLSEDIKLHCPEGLVSQVLHGGVL